MNESLATYTYVYLWCFIRHINIKKKFESIDKETCNESKTLARILYFFFTDICVWFYKQEIYSYVAANPFLYCKKEDDLTIAHVSTKIKYGR